MHPYRIDFLAVVAAYSTPVLQCSQASVSKASFQLPHWLAPTGPTFCDPHPSNPDDLWAVLKVLGVRGMLELLHSQGLCPKN